MGSCSPAGVVTINWLLVFTSVAVLCYVVIHELAHLRFRSHAEEFWTYLGGILPDFQRAKGWLDVNEGSLDDEFLAPLRVS